MLSPKWQHGMEPEMKYGDWKEECGYDFMDGHNPTLSFWKWKGKMRGITDAAGMLLTLNNPEDF